MRRYILTVILCAAAVLNAAAAFTLTATKVRIEDTTADKYNFFIKVDASTSSGEYEVCFDVWPAKRSAIGSFSASDGTIKYTFCSVHKVKANGKAVNMWYYSDPESPIRLDIVSNGDGTCTLSGSIEAARQGTSYTYHIQPFVFAYEEEEPEPEPDVDPFRFEPATATTVNFTADVVSFRKRADYIEVTLNEMANLTYDWIELRLQSDTMDMPAGTYIIDNSGDAGTLTASKGYLGGTKGDDPSYVAIRGDKENWGQYTPYYLESGSVTVSFNEKGDTITVTGEAKSHHGTTVHIHAKSYNMLYVVEDEPREPENVTLAIDTVMITYQSDLSDSVNNVYFYTFNFFSSKGDFPNVLLDVILDRPMALTEGTYTLEEKELKGLELFQSQADFNEAFFGGAPYVFVTASLELAEAQGGMWTYSMFITDEIGSEYRFSMSQEPHIIFYPTEEDEVDPKEQPYTDEIRETAVISAVLDSMVWQSGTVSKDGILDILLTQRQADINGLKAYLHLGMYTDVEYPAAGTYPVNGSEDTGSFSASLGRYGNVLIPCYLTLLDENGWAHAVWYITEGNITISYDKENQPLLSGECKTHYGSTVKFVYSPDGQGMEETESGKLKTEKVLRDGQIYLMYKGTMYDVQGRRVN